MWYYRDTIITLFAISMMIVAIVGYACGTEPPAHGCELGVGSCSTNPCTSDIGCGFDCFCLKFGSNQWGSCARTDW